MDFDEDVSMLLSQLEIYDQIWYVRHMPPEGGHSREGIALVKEFVSRLEEIPDGCAECFPVSNQLRVPSKTKPRIVAGFKTSCNGLDIFLEFQAPREAVHPESLNLCHSYVWEFR